MRRKVGRRVQELKRLGRAAEALAKKATALRREQTRFDTAVVKWARKNRIQTRTHKVAHSAAAGTPGKHCKPKIRTAKGVCVLTSEYRSSTGGLVCFYRCFKIAEDFNGGLGDWAEE
jgi:hypothetical protein